jgi:DNA-binding GntR family transcriptional regulator
VEANKTLSQTVSDQIADEIITGRLPPGARLDEQSLADRFGVSRSPIRDALRQLAATRLVLYVPHRGFSVAAFDSSELKGLYEAAGEVEALCARWCALRCDAAARKHLQFVHEQGSRALNSRDVKAYARLNDELHRLIYAGAHNNVMSDIAQNLRQRLSPFRSKVFFTTHNRMVASHAEHAELIAAIVRQDGARAAAAMQEHAAHSAMNALHFFEVERDGSTGRRRA